MKHATLIAATLLMLPGIAAAQREQKTGQREPRIGHKSPHVTDRASGRSIDEEMS